MALEKAIPPPRTDDVAPVKSIVPPFRLGASISAAASSRAEQGSKDPNPPRPLKIFRIQFQQTASAWTAAATGMIHEQFGGAQFVPYLFERICNLFRIGQIARHRQRRIRTVVIIYLFGELLKVFSRTRQ